MSEIFFSRLLLPNEKVTSSWFWSQFHQHYPHTFFIQIFCQSQNITRKSCPNDVRMKNLYVKLMLMKLTPEEVLSRKIFRWHFSLASPISVDRTSSCQPSSSFDCPKWGLLQQIPINIKKTEVRSLKYYFLRPEKKSDWLGSMSAEARLSFGVMSIKHVLKCFLSTSINVLSFYPSNLHLLEENSDF